MEQNNTPYPDDDHEWINYKNPRKNLSFKNFDLIYIKCKICKHIAYVPYNPLLSTCVTKYENSAQSDFKIKESAIPSCKELIMRRALT